MVKLEYIKVLYLLSYRGPLIIWECETKCFVLAISSFWRYDNGQTRAYWGDVFVNAVDCSSSGSVGHKAFISGISCRKNPVLHHWQAACHWQLPYKQTQSTVDTVDFLLHWWDWNSRCEKALKFDRYLIHLAMASPSWYWESYSIIVPSCSLCP